MIGIQDRFSVEAQTELCKRKLHPCYEAKTLEKSIYFNIKKTSFIFTTRSFAYSNLYFTCGIRSTARLKPFQFTSYMCCMCWTITYSCGYPWVIMHYNMLNAITLILDGSHTYHWIKREEN